MQHVLLVKDPSSGSRILYLSLSVLQTTLEFVALAWMAVFFKHRFSKKVYYSYIGLVFVFFAIHVVDFALLRIMNLSFWTAFDMMLGETWENFIELLKLTGIPMGVWLAFVPLALVLPMIGAYLYHLSMRFAKRAICTRTLTCTLCLLPVGLMGICLLCNSFVDPIAHRKFASVMPFKGTMLGPKAFAVKMERPIQIPLLEPESLPKIKARTMPNIYVFVAESLRADYFTEEVAPNLSPNSQKAIAAGNGTQISWYSIFHANSPLTWSTYQKLGPSKGALPLRLFKEMGYEIHCHSAAQLKYYNMDELLFGKERNLLTSCNVFPHYDPSPAWESDEKALQSVFKSLKKSGQMHIVFLDSSHFHYSWNPAFKAPYTPHSEGAGIGLTSANPEIMERIQNSYRNSVAYVDFLVGSFKYALHKRGLYKNAVIAFTGDHGEEFYEEGNLFHASD
ncbi:MAG TPA: sulfatase-like hydrolase/transferase, partial [Chlamydiales bacterium]|nr:sulfatase-like hydrolase/transferase [Chlamydiales bacterium]